MPAPHRLVRYLYNFDGQFLRPVTRALELRRHVRALGVNALDEVPDSTWFTNRIGVRDISPEELAAAPGGVGSPEAYKPWTIVSSNFGGATIGYVIKDSRGEKWLLKFDRKEFPETETATHVIVGKLFWGFGANVTEDYVAYVGRSELVLAQDATIQDVFGNKLRLTHKELDARLATVESEPDGRIRVLVSHWLDGEPLGGFAGEGVREDDPNDRIPHELRRDLRGAHALFAWLDHKDIQEGTTLDMWVEDPRDTKKHHVKHYLIDFGTALGHVARTQSDPRMSWEYFVDISAMTRSLFTFGFVDRPWEQRKAAVPQGLALYEVEEFDPGRWLSSTLAYRPIYEADRIDKFWASKIIIRFTPEQIRAVVATARLTDPRAAEQLTQAIIARQRATARYWFERVNPLDGFAIKDGTLCFDDLSIVHDFASAKTTTYTIHAYDEDTNGLGRFQTNAAGGRTCAPVPVAETPAGYTILDVSTSRPGFRGSTYVHLARGPDGKLRVIGIWRP